MLNLASATGVAREGSSAILGDWIAGFNLADVPDDVVEQAKSCIVDSVGCVVAGTSARPSRLLLDTLERYGGVGDVAIPATGKRLGTLPAAYFMAQSANALDFDDSFRSGAPCHPGATIIPPALALAQAVPCDGAELLRAVILGYEISLRIGRAVQPTPERKAEVYGFSTWQIFGAMAAAASLLRLPRAAIIDAFGIAAVHAPVPSLRKLGTEDPRPYPWTKNTYGSASEGGVLAALLASDGYVGSRTIFDGDRGFWIMSGSDRFRPELLTEGLGTTWLLREVGFKFYGCCRWTHTMLDALRDCGAGVDPDAIETIEVAGFKELFGLGGEAPTSIVDAQFNPQHLAALELLGRSPERGLADEDLVDPRVSRLRSKITMIHDPSADEAYYASGALPVRVTLRLSDGTTRAAARQDPSGSAAAGNSPEAIDAKFLRLTGGVLGGDRARSSLSTLRNLENHSIAELIAQIA
ncbi:2-methylcitrate dehydratase [Agaricicola taiwanensis]|uniref:2-methylcitrate dehydratase n=1 Tax=Agaricicola taiwanensis TaxID=591372 RepID=A0A8J2YH64_9RHOB|nr:MmgE/PrpD family protein [Agaricicola taiwanensis]GGE41058.1 2-methylcitrate dehydratase [Agaricicola taiwanensis]